MGREGARCFSTIFFQADDGVTGRELWAMPASLTTHKLFLPVVTRN